MADSSLRSIAATCGVSTMTVSRALRGQPGVSEALRARIREEAERMGYTPDPTVARLLTLLRQRHGARRQETIALIWPDADERTVASGATLSQARKAFITRAASLGFRTQEFFRRGTEISGTRLVGILRARGIEAVCIGLTGGGHGLRLDFDVTHFCASAMGMSLEVPLLHRSQFHHAAGMQLVMERLVAAGYRRPVLALRRDVHERTHRVLAGVFTQYHPDAERASSHLFIYDEHTDGLTALLRHTRADALISEMPDPPPEALRALQRGLQFVTLNRVGEHVRWAGIDQRYDLLASNAADLAIGLYHRNERGLPTYPKSVLHLGDWHQTGLKPPRSNRR